SQDFSMDIGSNELSYTFYSENRNDLNEAVRMVEEVMTENERLEDVTSTAEGAYVEHILKVDQADLLQYGLTTEQIVGILSNSSTEDVLTTVEKDGETLDVIVQQEAETEATSIDELLELEVPVPAQPGTVLPL